MASALNILYFSNEDVPANHAGAVHTWEVARGLVERGHAVTLVSAARKDLPRRENVEGVAILRAPMRLGGVKCNLRALALLPGLARKSWDVVMERYLTLNGLGYLFAAGRRLPYFIEVNGPHLEEITYRWNMAGTIKARVLTWWVDRQFARADGACAPNVNIIRPVAQARGRKIIWGVNEGQFSSRLKTSQPVQDFRARQGGKGKFVVVFVGSFRPWQGGRELPAIIAELRAQREDALFWFVGEGEDLPAIREEITRRGLEASVRFLGWQPHTELPNIMAAADAAVAPFNDDYYPPLKELGFYWAPTKILECLASGLPVVTSRYPVLDEMVEDGRSGYLVAAGDAAAFGAALAKLAADESGRRDMGAYAEATVKTRFGWKAHCALLEEYLRESIQRRKALARRSKMV